MGGPAANVRVRAPRRILLLALLPIGDTLFITPTIRALRERYPAARIIALAFAANAPVLATSAEVDGVMVWPRGGGRAALAGRLAGLRALMRSISADSPPGIALAMGRGRSGRKKIHQK